MARKRTQRRSVRAIDHTKRPELFAQFEAAYKTGERITHVCRRLQIPTRTGERWAQFVRVEIGAALRAIGIDEISQAKKLLQLQRARMPKWNPETKRFVLFEDGGIQLAATRELNHLLNCYPPPKEEQPAIPPVTLIFNTANLILPGEEPDYHNSARKLIEQRMPEEEAQEAGSGTPA